MRQSTGKRRRQAYHGARRQGHLDVYELVCVVIVLAAVIGLFAWIALNAGGGHFLL